MVEGISSTYRLDIFDEEGGPKPGHLGAEKEPEIAASLAASAQPQVKLHNPQLRLKQHRPGWQP